MDESQPEPEYSHEDSAGGDLPHAVAEEGSFAAATEEPPATGRGDLPSSGGEPSITSSQGHAEAESLESADSPKLSSGSLTQQDPRPAYAVFKDHLKTPEASSILNDVRSFVARFPPEVSRQVAADMIHQFQAQCARKLVEVSNRGPIDDKLLGEGFEKFIALKLHDKLFRIPDSEAEENEKLRQRIASLQPWLEFHHLRVEPPQQSFELAVTQLRNMATQFRAPKDKLVCVVNACKVLSRVCSANAADDEILPLLIWCLVKANPPHLLSNIGYMKAFRHPEHVAEEENKWCSMLDSAATFLQTQIPSGLDIDAAQYHRNVAVGQEEAKGGFTAAEKQLVRGAVSVIPMTFERVTSVQSLRVPDVAPLLAEYQEMARVLRQLQNLVR